jgi:hypothetical protein
MGGSAISALFVEMGFDQKVNKNCNVGTPSLCLAFEPTYHRMIDRIEKLLLAWHLLNPRDYACLLSVYSVDNVPGT